MRHENTLCKCGPGTSSELYWNKTVRGLHIPPTKPCAWTHLETLSRLWAVDLLSAVLKPPYEIHRPQTMSEQRDIACPITAETATCIKCLMRYEADSPKGPDRLLWLPWSFQPLPGVLQITSPDPGLLASDWPQQAYLPNRACLIGPRETMACVNSPRALDSRPTQQSLC